MPERYHQLYLTDILGSGRAIQSYVQDIADCPDVPRRNITNFRNLLTHEYFGVDLEIVWSAIKTEIPLLPDATKTIFSGEQTKESSRDAL